MANFGSFTSTVTSSSITGSINFFNSTPSVGGTAYVSIWYAPYPVTNFSQYVNIKNQRIGQNQLGTVSYSMTGLSSQTTYEFQALCVKDGQESTSFSTTLDRMVALEIATQTNSGALQYSTQLTTLPPAPSWTDNTMSNGTYNSYYSSSVSASNSPTYTWTTKPSWATASGGTLSGTPNGAGNYSWGVTASNDGGSVTASGTIRIYYPNPYWTDSTMSTTLRRGTAYSDSVSASVAYGSVSQTSSLTAGTLVSGLTRSSTGLSGTPTATGTFTITYYAENDDGTSISLEKAFTVKDYLCVWTDQTISTNSLDIGSYYSDSVSANNASSYSYTGSLPPGITLNTNTGAISGTATTAGTYTFTLKATNSTSESISTAQFSITVNDVGGRAFFHNGSTFVEKDVMFYNGNWNTRGIVYYHDGNTWQKSVQ